MIGESAVTDRMGVFGYRRPTTPFAGASGAHAFEALAPSNQTRYSLGMMFTDAAPGAFESFYTSHSLVGQLGACCYDTTWVSNQGRRGEYDSYATSLALEANEQVFLNELGWNDAMPDGHLVDQIARRGLFERARHATFIHLLGSHTDYAERYPEGFGFENVASVEDQYDNSILYTDHVLSELHRRFAGGRLIVSEDHYGSGFLPGYQDEFRTPLLIWTDDAKSIATIHGDLGGSRLNMESFDEMVRFLLGVTPEPRLSTSSTVSVLVPENVRHYKDLAALVPEK